MLFDRPSFSSNPLPLSPLLEAEVAGVLACKDLQSSIACERMTEKKTEHVLVELDWASDQIWEQLETDPLGQ